MRPLLRRLLAGVIVCTAIVGLSAMPVDAAQVRPAIDDWHIKNVHSGLCLVARVGSGELPVKVVACGNYADQLWDWGTYNDSIRNVLNNKCLVTRGYGESPGVATTCSVNYPDQSWAGLGYPFEFGNAHSGLCLAARGTTPETQVIQTTCGPWDDQLWTTY